MADCSGLDLLGHGRLCRAPFFTLSATSSSLWARCCFQKHFSARGAHLQVRTWALVPCGTGTTLAPRPSAAPGSHQLHHPVPSRHSQQHEDSPTMNHCPWTWTKVSTCLFHPVFPCHPHALGAFGIIPRGGTGQPLKRGCCKAGFGNPLLSSKGAISNSKHFQQKLRRKKNKKKSQTEQRLHLKNSLVRRKSLLPLIFFVPRTCSVELLFIHVSPTARKRNIFILLKL